MHVTFTLYVNPEQIRSIAGNGTDLMSLFLPISPFVGLLGVKVESLSDDEALLRLPWREELATTEDMVHGGAIAALADIAAMAAAWCGRDLPDRLRGVTTSLALEFLEPARAEDLLGRGRILRRGSTLTACDIDITTAGGVNVAKAIANYKVG
nr:thioesterase [Gordonia sp. NB41Y]